MATEARGGRALQTTAFVLLSSWFGLTGAELMFLTNPSEAISFFGEVWASSLLADAVFIGGSVLAFLGCRRLLDEGRSAWLVAPLSVLANLVVYWVSFLLMDPDGVSGDAFSAIGFVATWGWLGLIVCGAAPLAADTLERRRAARLVPRRESQPNP